MPVSHEFDRANRLVRSRAWGRVTAAEMLEGQKQLRTAPEFNSSHSQLFDCSDVTLIDATDDELLGVIANSPFSGDARRVIVLPLELRAAGSVLMQLLLGTPGRSHQVVATLAEAEEWIRNPAR